MGMMRIGASFVEIIHINVEKWVDGLPSRHTSENKKSKLHVCIQKKDLLSATPIKEKEYCLLGP